MINTKVGVAVSTAVVLGVFSYAGDTFNSAGANPIHNKEVLQDSINEVKDSMRVFKQEVNDSLSQTNSKVDKVATEVSYIKDDIKLIKEHLLGKDDNDKED